MSMVFTSRYGVTIASWSTVHVGLGMLGLDLSHGRVAKFGVVFNQSMIYLSYSIRSSMI